MVRGFSISTRRHIAIFDSGLGGLTVTRAICELLPNEDIVYLADTARVPFGTKSPRTIARFALQACSFLMRFDPKLVVVACNTVSAVALDELREKIGVELIGVLEPGAAEAVRCSKTSRIGVIATEATVNSRSYEKAIKALKPDAQVFTKACGLLVPIVEEGLGCDDPITRLVLQRYLYPLKKHGVDCLLLGCTHYPLLRKAIEEEMGPGVAVVDSATCTATAVKLFLQQRALLSPNGSVPERIFYSTDSPARFARLGTGFFGATIDTVYLAYTDDSTTPRSSL